MNADHNPEAWAAWVAHCKVLGMIPDTQENVANRSHFWEGWKASNRSITKLLEEMGVVG